MTDTTNFRTADSCQTAGLGLMFAIKTIYLLSVTAGVLVARIFWRYFQENRNSLRYLSKMNNFLRETRKLRNISGNVCIVLGNESCDLDSAVCSVSLAYYYYKNPDRFPIKTKLSNFLPVFNIPRNEYPLKTEVTYFFNQNSIQAESLTFKDEVEESFLRNNSLVLVDHHFSPYSELASVIYDHRPFDTSAKLSGDCFKQIELVGSCSSLIGNLFLQLDNLEDYKEPLKLLYAAIVLDTVNFSKDADKARPLDFEVTGKIETLLGIENPTEHREKLCNNLVKARADVSSLDSYQILFKDMKLVSSKSGKIKIAFPGYPILVQDYVKLDKAEENIKKFAESQKCSNIVLIGLKVTNGIVERDVGIVNIDNSKLFEEILDKIKNYQEPNLELEEHVDCNFLNGKFFRQKNLKASRKQILPLVKTVLENW